MSKFNNPSRALAQPRPVPALPRPFPQPASLPAVSDFPAPAGAAPASESPLVAAGFAIFCLFVMSGPINDWTFLFFGVKSYVSTLMVVLTPVLWLLSGNSLRGFRGSLGWLWLGFLGLILLGLPFSYWRGGSVHLLLDYLPRGYSYFFYTAAFVTSLKRCRTLMLVNVLAAAMVLISCLRFGAADPGGDSRFRIPNSIFSGNSNDLALQLTLGMTAFVFLLYLGRIVPRILAAVGIVACLAFMLKTGSRGCFLAVVLLVLFAFLVSKRKMLVALVAVPLCLLGIVLIPSSSLRRLATVLPAASSAVLDENDASAVASGIERTALIRKSLELTAAHPLFGVGAGQFAVAAAGEAAKNGEWAAWLGTHNSYTQVSSECGIPALFLYVAIILICLIRSFRLYRLAAGKPQFLEVEGLAFCLFSGTLVYAVATFFFHIAYSGLLPFLSGEIFCLYSLAYPMLSKTTGAHARLAYAPWPRRS